MSLTRIHIFSLLALTLLFPLSLAAHAQKADAPASTDCSKLATRTEQSECRTKYSETRIIYLTNTANQADANEILVAVRNMFDPSIKVYEIVSQNAIVVSTYPEELAKIEDLIHKLDRAHKAYRLTFTVAESDAGKQVGIEHFSMVAVDGQRASLKEGDRIPVATGSYSTENSTAPTQFTYLDVGMNFAVTVNSSAGGVVISSKVERSSVGPSNTIAGVQEPVVRQTVLEGVSAVTLGKPLMLGSIDIPNSTRHLDIDVSVDPLK
jgi:type II secretory pathway component GspD/PulD (secretin)